ncbi:MAG: hypothetical protein PHN18_10570 [Sulfurospirillaceae bacterium]|nr:hypothetical protein [Sulfurospirillaceae bacterium]MDD2827416.1 hypothetical protein [Sulfurospirillaceae bacterium]
MVPDFGAIIINHFTKIFENNIWLITFILVLAIGVSILRHDIAFEFNLREKTKNKLTENAFLAVILPILATLIYLYVKEFYFVLSLVLSIFVVYFLYWIGLIDRFINKMVGR